MDRLTCPSCGQHIEVNSRFCSECGKPIPEALRGTDQQGGAQVPQKSTALRDGAIIAAVLAVVGIGYFVFKEKPLPPVKPSEPAASENASGAPATGHPSVPGMEQGMSIKELEALPKDYASLVMMGNVKMDSFNFPVAAECYRRALAIDGSSADVRTDYGACLHGMGLPNRAIEEFKTVLKSDPKHTIAHFNLGIVYSELKEKDSATVYFKEYIRMDPNGQAVEAARKFLKDLGG